jgi:hypothetical protein
MKAIANITGIQNASGRMSSSRANVLMSRGTGSLDGVADGVRSWRIAFGRVASVGLVSLFALAGLLMVLSAPALADEAPEAPHATKPMFTQTTYTYLEGVLNPGKVGAEGSFESAEYFFLYNKSSSSCTGGSSTEARLSNGAGKEAVEQELAGLEAGSEYTVCLVMRSLLEHKEAVSAPVSFRMRQIPETLNAEPVTATTATLHGILNPQGEAEAGLYQFVYAPSTHECEEGTSRYAPEPPGVATGLQGQSVEVTLSDLTPDTSYTYCLIASRSGGGGSVYGAPVTLKTSAAAPAITREQSSSVGSTTARVSAEVAPDGLSTAYYVEYVSEAQYQLSEWAHASRAPAVGDSELPAAATPISVSEELPNLQPDTSYRFRFQATNTLGTTPGAIATFTTSESAASASALPDGRAYELVSPPSEGEAYLPPEPESVSTTVTGFKSSGFRAAADGNAVTWVGEPAATIGTGETGPGEGNQWLSTRTANGWQSNDITPTDSVETAFQAFSSNLTTAMLEGSSNSSLTSQVPKGCAALYSRGDETGNLTALFVAGHCGAPLFAGATADESEIIFQDEAALTPNAQPATEVPPGHSEGHSAPEEKGAPCMFGCNLYDLYDGQLHLVNVLPEAEGKPAETVPNATFGGYAGADALTTFSHAISNDGSRIFWTDTQAGPDMEHIYVLVNGTETVQVSGAAPAEYWTATPDGRYAFYTEDGELWRFDTDTRERVALTTASHSATGTGDLTGPGTGTGTTTEGSDIVTEVATATGAFAVGQQIKGVPGEGCAFGCIPEGATITAVGAGTLTLSASATGTGQNFGIAAGSNEITSLTTASGHFHQGERIFGVGIPAGARVGAVTSDSLQLTTLVTASGADATLAAGGSEVEGVIGANETGEDGSYLYFVANGALAPGASAKTCETISAQVGRNEREAAEGWITEGQLSTMNHELENEEAEEHSGLTPAKTGCNLYLLRGGVTTTLIGTLSAQDDDFKVFAGGGLEYSGDWIANVGEHVAEVTPDGRHLTFQSYRSLTGYDNEYQNSPQLEVYTYTAEGGQLACGSCDPTGAAPAIGEGEGGSKLPESTENADTYSLRVMSENGNRVFFTTSQSLAAQDTNGTRDVYEWEREGEGTCAPRTPARLNDGCVFLLSGGDSKIASFLVDADATGDNVFVEHVGSLGQVQAPVDHNLLYDVRIGGGFATTSQACAGTGCQGVPPAPPTFATPASTTFSGIGDLPAASPPKAVVKPLTRAEKLASALKACKKDKKKRKRVTCETRARKRYGKQKAKRTTSKTMKASNDRRTQS